jgi:hypothetical protein
MVAENPLGQDTSETSVRVTKKPKKATVDEELSSPLTAYHGDPMKHKILIVNLEDAMKAICELPCKF